MLLKLHSIQLLHVLEEMLLLKLGYKQLLLLLVVGLLLSCVRLEMRSGLRVEGCLYRAPLLGIQTEDHGLEIYS